MNKYSNKVAVDVVAGIVLIAIAIFGTYYPKTYELMGWFVATAGMLYIINGIEWYLAGLEK